jgi:two-component system, chemotaxis family, protein-glutamate methylesterase/glutaminase
VDEQQERVGVAAEADQAVTPVPQGPSLVVIGASAGGIEPLRSIVGGLPPDLAAAVLVVVHIPEHGRSYLPEILGRVSRLRVSAAKDGEPVVAGGVFVAPPGFHLRIEGDCLRLDRGPRENGHRPAIDVLFRSAAAASGPAVVGVVLSGGLDDGSAGAAEIARSGGIVVVQDPSDAAHPSMPEHALPWANHVVASTEICALLGSLVARDRPAVPDDPVEPPAPRVLVLTCPDCGGPLSEYSVAGSFRCRVDHRWSSGSLLQRHDDDLERAVWTAVRILEERISLMRTLADRAERRGSSRAEVQFLQKARALDEERSLLLRGFLVEAS